MATEATAGEDADAYEQFIERLRRINNIGYAKDILHWDQEVMMPEGGTPARSRQLSALSAVSHDLFVDEETGEMLSALEASTLTDEQAAVVREVRREYERSIRISTDLVEAISATSSEALPDWKRAKAEDDFSIFAPKLEELVELKREYAAQIDPDADPYAVLFADYEPYLGLDVAEETLARLRKELVPLVDAIRESDADLAVDAFEGTFDADRQEAVCRDVLDLLGYDWDRGRLDTAPHPFSLGTPFDARVTTRFDESDPVESLLITIHEFGHANYTLGLPREHYATPLGKHRDLSVHESQSRLWENHVGRSKAFWEQFVPTFVEHHTQLEGVTARDAYEAANQVYEDNTIRTEADELTYHMHIVVRFEIERELIAGDLDVSEVPEAWNDRYEQYLGVRPDTDAEGCLQDIHWCHGSFGYFPTYSLGSVMAAQLYAAAERDLDDLDGKVRAGEYDDLADWLREHVHRHGQRYTTDDLVEVVTGESFTPEYFVEYVTDKYGELYDL